MDSTFFRETLAVKRQDNCLGDSIFIIQNSHDMSNVEAEIRRRLKCNNSTCPFIQSMAYQKIRLAAIYNQSQQLSHTSQNLTIILHNNTITLAWNESLIDLTADSFTSPTINRKRTISHCEDEHIL